MPPLGVRAPSPLDTVGNVGAKIVGERQKSLGQLYAYRVAQKVRMIASDDREPHLAKQYEHLPSRKRYRSVKCNTVRTKLSFIAKSVELLNQNKCNLYP